MKIAYVSNHSPKDVKNWSGLIFYFFNILKKNHQVDWINPKVNKLPFKIKKKFYNKIFKKSYDFTHTFSYSKAIGKSLTKQLQNTHYDFIFAPAASAEIAFLKTNIPIIYYTDSVFQAAINYYSVYSNLTKSNIKEGNEIEQKALENCTYYLAASDWAIHTAKQFYTFDETKIHKFLFGANLEKTPTLASLNLEKYNATKCNLLLFGVDWKRKGGQIAFDTMVELNKKGLDAQLTIIGCVPPKNIQHEKLIVYPRLNKDNEAEQQKIEEILLATNFLILPTRAEAAGIVFCESAAFGIPSIATNTGGVADYVRENINGCTLPYTAKSSEYANTIFDIYNDKNKYIALRKSARNFFETNVNWDTWLEKITNLMENHQPKNN